jgi:CelD/BcsL family acetyltransferase involved in cellulose biosynthesis
MSGMSAEVVADADALARLEGEWWELWRRCPGALPFQAPGWLLPWWRHFAPGALFVLAARREGQLVGLAPGYIEDGALGRRILPLGISLSDHLDVLTDPACPDEALQALAAAAGSRRDAWDVWELEELLPDAKALRMPLPPGFQDNVEQQKACPFLPLPEGPVSLAAILPRAKRRHLNLARNRAARAGAVRIETADAGSIVAALEHLFRLHRIRWESRGGTGVLAPDAVQAFQRAAVPGLHAAGLVRIHLLFIAGQVAAAQYELVRGERVSVYLTGFDPAFEYESPNVILLAHAIELAIAEGRREVDFLRGQEPYKYEWGAVDRWNLKRSIRRDG